MADFDILKYFATTFPAALRNNAERVKKNPGKFRIVITGPAGGTWLIDSAVPGMAPNIPTKVDAAVDCEMTLSDEDFSNVMQPPSPGPSSAQLFESLFSKGALQVTGKRVFVLVFASLLSSK